MPQQVAKVSAAKVSSSHHKHSVYLPATSPPLHQTSGHPGGPCKLHDKRAAAQDRRAHAADAGDAAELLQATQRRAPCHVPAQQVLVTGEQHSFELGQTKKVRAPTATPAPGFRVVKLRGVLFQFFTFLDFTVQTTVSWVAVRYTVSDTQ